MKSLTKWTLLRASEEFGVSRETLRRELRRCDVEVTAGRRYSTREIYLALAGDLERERIRETRANANLKERELRVKNGELIGLGEVQTMVREAFLPVRQRLLALPSEMSKRCNPVDPQLARDALQRWLEESLPLIRDGLPGKVKEK